MSEVIRLTQPRNSLKATEWLWNSVDAIELENKTVSVTLINEILGCSNRIRDKFGYWWFGFIDRTKQEFGYWYRKYVTNNKINNIFGFNRISVTKPNDHSNSVVANKLRVAATKYTLNVNADLQILKKLYFLRK